MIEFNDGFLYLGIAHAWCDIMEKESMTEEEWVEKYIFNTFLKIEEITGYEIKLDEAIFLSFHIEDYVRDEMPAEHLKEHISRCCGYRLSDEEFKYIVNPEETVEGPFDD